MRILIDLLHPAHVHVFRNFIATVEARGDVVLVVARDKDVTLDLLAAYGLESIVISRQSAGIAGLTTEWALRTGRLVGIARKFKPDVMTGIMGVSIAPAGRLLRVPSVVFYDTEFASMTNRVVYPLATHVVTPDCYAEPVNGDHIVYPSYHELAYLHPSRFAPDANVVSEQGVDPEVPFSLVRFVSWEASHDRHEIALTPGQKRALVDRLSGHGRVLITSEADLPPDLASLAYRGSTAAIHHVIGCASLVAGESATMAAEAAVLGTPALYIARTSRGYVDELAGRYGLVHAFTPAEFNHAIERAETLFAETAQAEAADARRRLLDEKIDLTAWMVDFFERFGRR